MDGASAIVGFVALALQVVSGIGTIVSLVKDTPDDVRKLAQDAQQLRLLDAIEAGLDIQLDEVEFRADMQVSVNPKVGPTITHKFPSGCRCRRRLLKPLSLVYISFGPKTDAPSSLLCDVWAVSAREKYLSMGTSPSRTGELRMRL